MLTSDIVSVEFLTPWPWLCSEAEGDGIASDGPWGHLDITENDNSV